MKIGGATLLEGDTLSVLRTLPDESVHCCVTSPPYWGLRDYGVAGQIGLEATPEEYVGKMVEVFAEVRRVLRADGTCWVNLGDSYAGAGQGPQGSTGERAGRSFTAEGVRRTMRDGLKPKDLVGVPWRVAFALQADGWYLRSDIIWAKPNPMPESVTDRPTKAHEYVFLLTKSAKYFYDAEAVKEPPVAKNAPARNGVTKGTDGISQPDWLASGYYDPTATRNRRTVWTVATQPFPEAHFATFPPRLIEPCILAGCPAQACPECGAPWVRVVERVDTGRRQKMADGWDTGEGGHGTIHRDGREKGEKGVPVMATTTLGFRPTCACGRPDTVPGVVLDPFLGAATTAIVAAKHDRRSIGIELNPAYLWDIAAPRIRKAYEQPSLFAGGATC